MKYVVRLTKEATKENFLQKAQELNITILEMTNNKLCYIECSEENKDLLQKEKHLVRFVEPEVFYHLCKE